MSTDHFPVILIVDDQTVIRKMIGAYLEDKRFRILEAADGAEAMKMYAEEEVDLILLDLRMPKMDGLEVLSAIRKQDTYIPIIVVSGEGGVKDVVEALRLGANDFIQKPVTDMSILLHSINQSLERVQLVTDAKNYQRKLEKEVAEKTEEIQSLNSRLKKVVESAKKFLGCGEIEKSGPMILKEFAYHMNAGGGSLYTVSESSLQLIHSLDSGHAAKEISRPLQAGRVLAHALDYDDPQIIEDIIQEGWSGSGWSGYLSKSCMVFPLLDHEGHVFAILTLHNPQSGHFARHDREIGAILASYASEALQTAKALATIKQNEELMLQSQKLEAIGTLAGGIAHDFNNILSAIVGYTDLSLFSNDLDEPIKKNLEQIKKASQRARDLVRQILSFSRVEEAKVSSLDITPIIKEALKLLRASIPSSITIEQDVPGNLGLIRADPGKIHQVLMNLCTNAAQAMHDRGGVLRVECSRAVPRFEDPELRVLVGIPCVKLSVSDTGSGIKPEHIGRIFEPYFSTKEKSEGTGLGLALVHGIVRGSGGVVTVESETGRGSVFNVYFPCEKEDAESPSLTTDLVMPRGSERILFVDDEETLAEMAGEMLKKLGYKVRIMTSSVDAWNLLTSATDQFDLVITDQTMPKISGIDLARQTLKANPCLPVILYTGYSAVISDDEAKEIGISEVLMKPLSMTLLSQAVRKVLDRVDHDCK